MVNNEVVPWQETQDPVFQRLMPNQIFLDPFARTLMLGPKCLDLDINIVTNVHVSTKLTVGTSEHSFKSIDEDW